MSTLVRSVIAVIFTTALAGCVVVPAGPPRPYARVGVGVGLVVQPPLVVYRGW